MVLWNNEKVIGLSPQWIEAAAYDLNAPSADLEFILRPISVSSTFLVTFISLVVGENDFIGANICQNYWPTIL